MKCKQFSAVLLIIFLAACSTGQMATIAPPTAESATSTDAILTPSLTKTSRPTKTPTPTFPPTMTIPAGTLNAIATVEAIRTNLVGKLPELEEYISSCGLASCYGVDVSPDGQWVYFSDGNLLEILHINGNRVGKYSFQEISGRSDVVEGGLGGIHWSNDGQYLYLSTSFGDGGPGPYFGYEYSVARVNLQNGTWKDTGVSGVLSFSPNDKFIVYSTNVSEIRVRDLQSGEEKIYVTPEYYQYFGMFVWSANSKHVIFVAVPEDFDDPSKKFALFMIDLESDRIVQLYEDRMPFYYPVAWVENDKVSLNKDQRAGTWTLDLSTDPPTISP
jgi:WD40 repeat protein